MVGGGGVLSLAEVVDTGRVGLDEQDVAGRAGGGDGVEVERGLHGPVGVLGREVVPAVLVELGEAAVRRRAPGKAVGAAEDGQIGLGGRVAAGVDDGDRLARAARGQVVRRPEVVRGERVGGRGGRARGHPAVTVGHDHQVTGRIGRATLPLGGGTGTAHPAGL